MVTSPNEWKNIFPVLLDDAVLQEVKVLQDDTVLQEVKVLQDDTVLQDNTVLQDDTVLGERRSLTARHSFTAWHILW